MRLESTKTWEPQYTHSVMRVGLLPNRTLSVGTQAGVDLSAIGFRSDPENMFVGTALDFSEVDVKLIRRPTTIGIAKNLPMPDVLPARYAHSLIEGFTDAYKRITSHREQFLSHVNAIRTLEIRVLLRNTATYQQLLTEGYHPSFMQDAKQRDQFVDHLWLLAAQKPEMRSVVPLERASILCGNVPLFLTRCDTRDVYSSDGVCVEQFFHKSAFELCKMRLEGLGEHDLERQVYLIRGAMGQLEYSNPMHGTTPIVSAEPNLARQVAWRLERTSFARDGEATWVSMVLAPNRGWFLSPSTHDLYSGLAGIALFLAYYAKQDPSYVELALRAADRFYRAVDIARQRIQTVGAFTGWGSVVYTSTHLAVLWRDERWVQLARQGVSKIGDHISKDQHFDVVGGAAGALLATHALHTVYPHASQLEVMMACGDHLIEHAVEQKHGVAWIEHETGCALGGFGHGTSGVALALLKLGNVTGLSKYTNTARAALEFERSLFVQSQQNWQDQRPAFRKKAINEGSTEAFMTAWCHGAVGIGLSRTRFPELDDEARVELNAAVIASSKEQVTDDHCVCHGAFGCLELLFEASLVDASYAPKLADAREKVWASLVDGIRSGLAFPSETLGFMSGITGIGYSWLRFTTLEPLPSVLLLDAPNLVSS
jgi:type 2 lantibiotic biosynthesis protein LanM